MTSPVPPSWRSIAFSRVSDAWSCIKRGRVRSPQSRTRAELVRGIVLSGLDDAVAGPDVVQQKITVGMDVPVAERVGHGEGPPLIAVPGGAVVMTRTWQTRSRSFGTTHARLGHRRGRQLGITRRGLRPANELSEVVDIGQT